MTGPRIPDLAETQVTTPCGLGRPLRAVARVRYGPVPLDFEWLAERIPAVESGLALAGDADLELHLACVDQRELRTVVNELRRSGAARVQVELVLRRLIPRRRPETPAPALARTPAQADRSPVRTEPAALHGHPYERS
ncbi:hypothetical protein [Kitasatospora sp. MAP5-34]|uniref:hypothetical protein n=1 Tax=Kitasatospora sp. MAP5-34 TaxID=3035102 RepID=UPI002475D4E7|nr:hypothetical protein [Kitasatospora sp. MAP5-34]MDH6575434.1 hypothetical protein [Kitasatospora sp. MAP5-34]